jgi:hypothetical protein
MNGKPSKEAIERRARFVTSCPWTPEFKERTMKALAEVKKQRSAEREKDAADPAKRRPENGGGG